MTGNLYPAGRPIWIDLTTNDVEGAKAFYGAVFGWTFHDQGAQFGNYHMVRSRGLEVAGLMAQQDATDPPTWTVYLHTPDAQQTCAKATAAGGQVLVAPMPLPGLGLMGVVRDVTGLVTGMWQPTQFEGMEVTGGPDTASWFEIYTPDFGATLAFYSEVFGWTVEPMANTARFRYAANQARGGEPVAGVMEAPFLKGQAIWRIWLASQDVDAAAERVVQAGGRLVDQVLDSGFGRFAEVIDPQGASFVLCSVERGEQDPGFTL